MSRREFMLAALERTQAAEAKIASHPNPEIARFYLNVRDQIMEGIEGEGPCGRSDFEWREYLALERYTIASAYLAAWFTLSAEWEKRNVYAEEYTEIVGRYYRKRNPNIIRDKHVLYEAKWRAMVKAAATGQASFVPLRGS